jgi:hypothetical protein
MRKRLQDEGWYVHTLEMHRTDVVDPSVVITIKLSELVAMADQAKKSAKRWKARKHIKSKSFFIHLNKKTSFFVHGDE